MEQIYKTLLADCAEKKVRRNVLAKKYSTTANRKDFLTQLELNNNL